jgi:exodeoxyribonuclease V gamma subunit
MIQTYRSNRLSKLAELLAALPEFKDISDPFYSPVILVPNLDTSRWLKLELAGRNGFAGNLSFQLPAEWQWNQIRKLFPDIPKLLPTDPEPITWILFDMLRDQKYLSKFDILDRYVQSRPNEIRETALFELCRILGALFDQYQIYRPEMLLMWEEGSTEKRKDEQWQSRIWRDLNRQISRSGLPINRAELYREITQAIESGKIPQGEDLFVFNPGLIPKPIVSLLEIWGRRADVHLFLVQPSTGLDSEETNQHPLVSSFGEEARAQSLLWSLSEPEPKYEVSDSYQLLQGDEILKKVQKAISNNLEMDEKLVADTGISEFFDSVRIVSCHSRIRETEALYDFLLEQFEKDETLNPEDVLVVTPDLDPYRSAIHAIFGHSEDSLPDIPYYIPNAFKAGEPELLRAFSRLMDLLESRFEFHSVIDLFLMKPVHKKFGCSAAEAFRVNQWMEENHVHWGLDEDHRKEWDQPGSALHHTWRAAMRRGWLGQLMATEPGEIFRDVLLFSGVEGTSGKEIWAGFSSFLHSLEELRMESKKKRSPEDWSEFFEDCLEKLFLNSSIESLRSHVITKCLQELADSASTAKMDHPVGYSLAAKWLKKKFSAVGGSGAQFNRGITFSTMVPVRSIPFRIIALIGLNEGVFPRKMTSVDFDLMQQHPQPTDRNRRNEDRNLFLESIMAAEKVHYCSYIGRSQTDNEPIPPSPVVSEWIAYLSKITGLRENEIVTQLPLTSYSPSSFSKTYRGWSKTGYQTARKLTEEGNPVNGLYRPDLQLPVNESGIENIDLRDLIMVVTDPFKGFLASRYKARLYDQDEESQEFEINALQYHILFDRLLGWRIHDRNGIDAESVLLGSGILPSGSPGRMELTGLVDAVDRSLSVIREYGVQPERRLIPVDISLSGQRILGDVRSYSSERYLDIQVSGRSAKTIIKGWINHLAMSHMNSVKKAESLLICELKKEPVTITYKPVSHPTAYLQGYLNLFLESISKPVPFYPETVLKYVENIDKGDEDALDKAIQAFEGTGHEKSRADRDNLSTAVLLGDEAAFMEEMLQERFCVLIRDMLNHIEEG